MDPTALENAKRLVRQALAEHAFVRASDTTTIVSRGGRANETGWIFDIRSIILKAPVMDALAQLFWNQYRDASAFQISGLETAGIPLVAMLVASAREHGREEMSGVYIRKSRKRDALLKMVEGGLVPGRPLIVVDDLTNSGNSLKRQIEVLKSLGHTVVGAWTVMRFRDAAYYRYFHDKGIPLVSLFELNDFADTLGTKNLISKERPILKDDYVVKWKFSSPKPSYHLVGPKSDPVIDETRLYVGSDNGTMWALNQSDGSALWSKTTGSHPKGKGIFSSPALHDGTLYFGAYDGNTYALDAKTGVQKWISLEADWVGSSPALAPDIGLLFIGLEFGLWKKRGGIAALDLENGSTKWVSRDMPCYTHSSPRYIREHNEVAIGSNDGCVYLFDALTGELRWKFATGTVSEKEARKGFSSIDIKESVGYDAERDRVIVANIHGSAFFIDRKRGTSLHEFKAEAGFYTTPVVFGRSVFLASLDKNLYCIDLDSFEERWRWRAGARIFATPTIIGNSIFIGANTGRMTELDPATGLEHSSMLFTERITNRVAYNPATRRFFVPTFANEIYCLERAA